MKTLTCANELTRSGILEAMEKLGWTFSTGSLTGESGIGFADMETDTDIEVYFEFNAAGFCKRVIVEADNCSQCSISVGEWDATSFYLRSPRRLVRWLP